MKTLAIVLGALLLTGCAQAMYRNSVAPPSYWRAFTPEKGQTEKDREWDAGQCYNAADVASPMSPEVKAQARKEAGWLVEMSNPWAGGGIVSGVFYSGPGALGPPDMTAQVKAWATAWRAAFTDCMVANGYRRPGA